MILVVGGLADSVTELVCARLEALGYPYRLFDLGHYPGRYRVSVEWRGDGPEGAIEGPGWTLDLADVTGVYARFLGPEGRLPPPGPADGAELLRAEADAGLMALLEDLPCPVINRVAGGMSNNSKPYQALLIERAGLRAPPTLVTNDAEAVRAFHERHGAVIYKSTSGVRSIVRRLEADGLSRLELLQNGPAQFQAYIPGVNVRVHTVGQRVFAVRVQSEAVDYRYAHRDGLEIEMQPTMLPAAIERACLAVARDLDLLLAGIDLKQTVEGEWYCFEVNPSPGFLYFERHSGVPISTAIAELLYGRTDTGGQAAA